MYNNIGDSMQLLNLNVGVKLDNTEEVKDLLRKQNSDICVLQECMNGIEDSCFPMYQSKNDFIKLKQYPYSAFAPLYIADGIKKDGKMTRDFGGKAEKGSLLLSKHNIKDHANQFYYNEYRYECDETEFCQKDWCRSIQNAILDIDGNPLQIINVDGIWNEGKIGDDRTLEQSRFILSKVRTDIPCIVVGDFNLLPHTESIHLLNEQLRNLIEEYQIESTERLEEEGIGESICDYIFVNDKVRVNNLEIIMDQVSDHFPLLLDFDVV